MTQTPINDPVEITTVMRGSIIEMIDAQMSEVDAIRDVVDRLTEVQDAAAHKWTQRPGSETEALVRDGWGPPPPRRRVEQMLGFSSE